MTVNNIKSFVENCVKNIKASVQNSRWQYKSICTKKATSNVEASVQNSVNNIKASVQNDR